MTVKLKPIIGVNRRFKQTAHTPKRGANLHPEPSNPENPEKEASNAENPKPLTLKS